MGVVRDGIGKIEVMFARSNEYDFSREDSRSVPRLYTHHQQSIPRKLRSYEPNALTLSGPLAGVLLNVAHCSCLERSGWFIELEFLGDDSNGPVMDYSRSKRLYVTGQDSLRHLPQ